MAFNPFATFRKNRTFWMASAILVCMVTFVFCGLGMIGGGGKGGLEGILLNLVRGRGEVYLTVNDRNYYSEDLEQLKRQRNLAGDFMRELTKESIEHLSAMIKQASSTDKEKQDPLLMDRMRIGKLCFTDLNEKLQRDPRFFHGGVKLDDLIEFMLWRNLANKLGVEVSDAKLSEFLRHACHGFAWGYDAETVNKVDRQVRYTHGVSGEGAIRDALKQEFRVQIVQFALINRRPADAYVEIPFGEGERKSVFPVFLNKPFETRISPTPEQLYAQYVKNRSKMTLELLPVSLDALAKQVELPKDEAARNAVLKSFYEANVKNRYNPTSDTAGFNFQEQAEIQYFTADAGMEYYKQPAHAVAVLQKTPPVAFNPLSPLSGAVGWLATPSAWRESLQRDLESDRRPHQQSLERHARALVNLKNQYLDEKDEANKQRLLAQIEMALNSHTVSPYKDSASSVITQNYYSPGQFTLALTKPNPDGVAALVGGLAGSPLTGAIAYQENAYHVQAKKIAPMVALDRPKRILAGLEIFLSQTPALAGPEIFTAAAVTYQEGLEPQYLPIAGYLEDELRARVEERLAQRWVNDAMKDVKRQLEANNNETYFNDQVAKLKRKYSRQVTGKDGKTRTVSGLRFGETAALRTEYDIDLDEDLKLLRDAYEQPHRPNNQDFITVNIVEGRSGKPEMLKEGDFHKLFFGSEPLGVGAPQLELRTVKIWPPIVKPPKSREDPLAPEQTAEQKLFETAKKPFVFWKSVRLYNQPLIPETIKWDSVDKTRLAFIEKEYRANEARAKLLPEVTKVAQQLYEKLAGEDPNLLMRMRELANQQGTEIIRLIDVTKLVKNPSAGKIEHGQEQPPFVEYDLPARKIAFPRADMVQQVLSLRDLSAPLKIEDKDPKPDIKELNELNAKLYKPKVKAGQVQVLTNKPRSVYYITAVIEAKDPSDSNFYMDMMAESLTRNNQGAFIDQVQRDYGKEAMRLMVQQMRKNVVVMEPAKKYFADEEQKQK